MSAPARLWTRAWLRQATYFALSLLLLSTATVGHELIDTFHEGEYLGLLWTMQSYYRGESAFPLVIHGGLDYLPSFLAYHLYGPEHIIVGTRVVNTVIVAVAWSLFVGIFDRIIQRNRASRLWLLAPLLLLGFASWKLTDSDSIHKAFVNPRDLLYVASVYFAFSFEAEARVWGKRAYLVLFAAACCAAPFWSYDRGLVTVAFFAAFVAGLLFRRQFRDVVLVAVTGGCVIAVLIGTGAAGTLTANIGNVAYWARNSGIWSFPFSARLVLFSLPIYLLLVAVAAIAASLFIAESKRSGLGAHIAIFALMASYLPLVASVVNRLGGARAMWGLWPAAVIAVYFASLHVGKVEFSFRLAGREGSLPGSRQWLVLGSCAALVLYIATYFPPYLPLYYDPKPLRFDAVANSIDFARNAVSPKQDRTVVGQSLLGVADFLNETRTPCIFAWTNEGAIALLTGLPYCTRFPYAVYASAAEERAMLDELERANPPAIVSGSDNWAFNIDGKPMAQRLPVIDAYIAKNYPHERVVGSYRIRYRESP